MEINQITEAIIGAAIELKNCPSQRHGERKGGH
jgi:hypothetical protein